LLLLWSHAIRGEFAQVARSSSLSQVINLITDWADTVAIVDAGNPKDVVAQLIGNNHCIDAARFIILMRANQSVEDYRAIIGTVGAILPDGATLQEIALAARIIRHGITLLPTAAISAFLPAAGVGGESTNYYDERSFTDREHAVLELISQGASNKVIGRKLDITESTVRVHVRAILKKLGMQNRTQAALYAVGHKNAHMAVELFRPVASMVSAIVGAVVINARTFFPDYTTMLLLEASAVV
jgi:two-component system, NarL family, nitrate/nitrite response regulator NarL